MRKIFIASDHAGFTLKSVLIPYLQTLDCDVEDLGAMELIPDDDYPLYIRPCAEAVAASEGVALGVIIGGSGQGEAMVANRTLGVRAAVFYGESHATAAIDAQGSQSQDGYDIVRLARMHNGANILSLGARFVTEDQAKKAVEIFLHTPFLTSEHHQRRINEF